MATVDLDTDFLKSAHPKQQVVYLRRLHDEGASELAICQALTEAVGSKRLPVRILSLYFGCRWNRTPELAVTAVKRGSGVSLRRHAILLAGRLLAKPTTWEATWKLLGGIKGMVALFASISVHEVKLLASAMMFGSLGQRIPAREEATEELLKALLPKSYPKSEIQSQDQRPLQHLYARMLPSCSAEFMNILLDDEDESNPLYKHCNYSKLMKAHRSLMRSRVEEAVLRQGVMDEYTERAVSDFLHSDTTLGVAAVSLSLRGKKRWPIAESELHVITHHLRKAMKKSRPFDAEIRPLLSLTLQVAQARRERVYDLWPALCSLWQRRPTQYEDLFVKAISLGLADPKVKIGQICSTGLYGKLREVRWDWALLRLYCLYVPEKGIDIDKATDLKPLAEQKWPVRIFSTMSNEQAERILMGLYAVNPDYNFLDPESDSILQFRAIDSMARRNFNVELLMTMWQRSNEEALQKAKRAVDKLRQKASASKEQSDRAEIARAASVYAIASGDLDLYLETVMWQQRYVRDPLTVKTLYSRDIVLTHEGIELLAAIPEKLPDDMTLNDVADRIAKGNEVLITFHKTVALAKREPSFQQRDWDSVTSLAARVLKKRAYYMKRLVKSQLAGKETEAFSVLWDSSLVLVDKLDEKIHACADFYEDGLSPASLAAITKIMLDSVTERHKKKTWRPEDDHLDAMSQSALYRITGGEEPEQAMPLVLQTVLERPDASSLHRSLLSAGLLKSLSAKDSQRLLLEFAAGIGEKLEEQSYVKVGEPENSKATPSQPLVKVTTAKYLAQLLDNAEFIASDAAIEVLIELFSVGQHRDVRLATLDSLLNSLNGICNGPSEVWRSNPFFEKILQALETIIPIAGSINERRPPREEDWREAAGNRSLPEISEASRELPPLLQAIVMAPIGVDYPNLADLQTEFVTRLILPILRQSQDAHQRWMSLFLVKYGDSSGLERLPPTPISPLVWREILPKYAQLLPPDVLEGYYQYITTTSFPTSELKDFHQSLRLDSALRNNPAVQHWLQVYDPTPDEYHTSGLRWLLVILDHLYRNGASISRAIEMIVSLVSATFQDYENHINTWTGFVGNFRPPFDYDTNTSSFARECKVWEDTRQPILKKITKLLMDQKRRQARQPAPRGVLPSTLELQILLLPYPRFRDGSDEEAECDLFVAKLDELILSSLQDGMNVLQWPKIGEATSKISQMIRLGSRLRLALRVGRLEMTVAVDQTNPHLLTALNLVRLKTAMMLIEEGWSAVEDGVKGDEKAKFEDLARRVKTMVQKWQTSYDENIALEIMEWKRVKASLWSDLMKR